MENILRKPNYDPIFDIFEIYSPQNDESIESENNFAINILSDELFINNYKMNKTNESDSSFSIESELSSLSKKADPLENIEQINEVKYNFFMILNNDCSYNEEYNDIFSISKKKLNEIKLRRLVIQKMNIVNENKENKKDYIFFPCNSTDTINFNYEIGTSKQFTIKINKNDAIIMCDGQNLMQEEILEKDFPSMKIVLENEKTKYKEKRNYQKIKNKKGKYNEKDDKENNIKKNQIISDINKSEDNNKNIIIEPNKNEENTKDYSFSLIDLNSDDEVRQKSTFYIKQEDIVYRFSFCNYYTKEIDGMYTSNKTIDLKIKGEINLSDSMINLFSGINFNIDNDLKSHIIYKNFESNVIEKNTPMFLEIKKSFVLFDLLTQIKQNVKIINHIKLENKDIKLPQLIIGIMCNYEAEGAKVLFEKLNNKYEEYKDKDNKISILEHNLNIINEEINGKKIKVLIGVIKDGIINKYPLNIQDYNIQDPETKSNKRVDLRTLNKMALEEPYKDNKIEEIFNKFKGKYKSLTSQQTLTLTTSQLSSFSTEENKILKEKIKKMENEKKIMEEQIKKDENEKKIMLELLSKHYSTEYLNKLLEENKNEKK